MSACQVIAVMITTSQVGEDPRGQKDTLVSQERMDHQAQWAILGQTNVRSWRSFRNSAHAVCVSVVR